MLQRELAVYAYSFHNQSGREFFDTQKMFVADPETKEVIMIGENGGDAEGLKTVTNARLKAL